MENFPDVASLLKWLVYGGGAILFVSWLLDQIPAFGKLSEKAKYWINMVLVIAVGLAAYALLTYLPASYFALADPWFLVVAGLIVLYNGQQLVHRVTRAGG